MKFNQKFLKEKSVKGAICQIFFGIIFGLVMINSTNAQIISATHIVSDSSPTSVTQAAEAVKQSVVQTQSKLQDYFEYAEQGKRWIDTVNHYSQIIQQNAKRFTSLRGIMGFVEQQVGLSDDTLKSLSDLGKAIRVSISLKNQFIGMIRSRLAMINDLEQRARNGIFDPRADMNDLENYLTSTMGRKALARIRSREKIAEQDPEMERLTVELEKIRAARAAAEAEKKEIENRLGRETSMKTRPREVASSEDGASTPMNNPDERVSSSAEGINSMILRIGQLEQLINDLSEQERKLMKEITERYQMYQTNYDTIYFRGEQWKESVDGWLEFTKAKNAQLGKMIDIYGNTDLSSRDRIVKTP